MSISALFKPALAERARSLMSVGSTLGLLMGLALPLLSVLLYHPYTLSMTSAGLEVSRQLGAPFVLGELGIIIYARRRGFALGTTIGQLTAWVRFALAVFLASFWISSVTVSPRASFSISMVLVWLIHLYAGAAVYDMARRHAILPRHFIAWFVPGLAALAVIAAYHVAFPPPGMGPDTWQFGAPIPGFISSRLFGAWAGGGVALLFGLAWRAEADRHATGWIYPAIALAAGLVTWSGTRAALAGNVVAFSAVMLALRSVGPEPHPMHFWRRGVFAVLAGSLVMALLMPPIPGGLWFRPGGLNSMNDFSSGRLELWAATLKVAIHRPLLGHGMGSTWWLVSLNGFYHVQPHNALVEFFMSWGLIPSFAALALLGAATWRVHVKARRVLELLPLVLGIDYLLATSMFDGMLHFSEFIAMLMIMFGICLGTRDSVYSPTGSDAFDSRASNARLRSSP